MGKIALFSAALIWGSSFFMVENATDIIAPNFLLAIRFSIATIVLSIIFHKKLREINIEYLWQGAIIGFCLFTAYSTQTIGITDIDNTPGKNAFLTAIYCVLVPFLFWIVNKTKPDKYNFISAFMCLGGIGLVSLKEGFTVSFGDSLTLLGGFFYAAHIVAVSKFSKDKDPIIITILQFFYSAIYATVITLLFEEQNFILSTEVVLPVLYLSLFCTAIALLLQNIGQKLTDPASASIILSLEAVFGVLFSVLFVDEKLTFRLVFGFILIFIAVIISETKLSFLKK